jgi:hypothetical protein
MKFGGRTKVVALLGCLALMLLVFPSHSVFGVLFIFLGSLCSYQTTILFFRKVQFDKLVVVTFGIFLSYVCLVGFLLRFFGMEISSWNIFYVFALLAIAFTLARWKMKAKGPEISFDWKRAVTLAVIFLASFFFYIYPALPALVSPCTPGFDCTHHIEYSQSIYQNKTPIAPVDVWAFYPFGLHTNVAVFSYALTSAIPSDNNMTYPFIALITALSIVVTCGILMDRNAGKLYVLLLAALLMLSVYPASALIGYGFWAQVFGMFFVMLFFWVLDDYANRTGHKTLILLSFISIASFLSYQVLVAMPIVLGMVLAILTAPQMKLKKRAIHLVFFCSIFFLVFSMNTWENYSRYLSSETDIFADTPTGYQTPVLTYAQRHSVNFESFQTFQLTYKRQLEQQGAILFFEGPERYGILAILFAMFAVITARKRDASSVFFISVLFEMASFHIGKDLKSISLYYFSKTAYIMVYPLLLFSVIGIKKTVDCWGVFSRPIQWKKLVAGVMAVLILILIAYTFELQKHGALLFGDNKQVMSTTFHDDGSWPLIAFNRIDYFYALTQGREPFNYTFSDWIQGKKP